MARWPPRQTPPLIPHQLTSVLCLYAMASSDTVLYLCVFAISTGFSVLMKWCNLTMCYNIMFWPFLLVCFQYGLLLITSLLHGVKITFTSLPSHCNVVNQYLEKTDLLMLSILTCHAFGAAQLHIGRQSCDSDTLSGQIAGTFHRRVPCLWCCSAAHRKAKLQPSYIECNNWNLEFLYTW